MELHAKFGRPRPYGFRQEDKSFHHVNLCTDLYYIQLVKPRGGPILTPSQGYIIYTVLLEV